MNETEIMVKKLKTGKYEASDKLGRKAEGFSKEQAIALYHLYYDEKEEQKSFIDFAEYSKIPKTYYTL